MLRLLVLSPSSVFAIPFGNSGIKRLTKWPGTRWKISSYSDTFSCHQDIPDIFLRYAGLMVAESLARVLKWVTRFQCLARLIVLAIAYTRLDGRLPALWRAGDGYQRSR
jgi:hypothetical protein